MEETITKESKWKKEEEEAKIQIYKYVFDFAEAAAIKCAIELKIADAVESHGRSITLSQISSALNCSPPLLFRIMRFFVRRIFKEETTARSYSQTPLSHMLITVAPLLVLENSPTIVESWHNLSARLKNNDSTSDLSVPFEVAHGKGIWSYAATNLEFNRMFNEGLGCNARVITLPTILESCGDIFNGIGSLVDVGGGNGTTLSILVKAFPWMKGINFDLPNFVSTSEEYNGVEHVAGNMLHFVPNADAAFFMPIFSRFLTMVCILHK
ncbi:acetylserotonin O-methyltransferase-like [Benincasa hispida]|uniref:acetylserotonin O-methyltransferase-like n=1 Tax=Benincasa hispida TaxID=102211 RepID=UPI001901C856|nr:acetylserotonin O-methyltransferase-like [Benincasa hispida]